MRTFVAFLLLLAIPSVGFARGMQSWSKQRMFVKADLVVVAVPVSTTNTSERCKLPEGFDVAGVETEFEVRSVKKGDTNVKKFVLHHYRLATRGMPANAPHLVSFDPSKREPYVCYLRKEADGRYAPVNGQTDPVFAIRKDVPPPPGTELHEFKSVHMKRQSMTRDMETKKIRLQGKHELWYKEPDFYLEINDDLMGREFRYERIDKLYTYYEGQTRGYISSYHADPGLEIEWTYFPDKRSYRKIGSETISGQPCDVYEHREVPKKHKMWLSTKNGFLMQRYSVYGPTNGDRATETISTVTEVEFDIPLPDSLFQLPANIEFRDDHGKGPAKP